MPNAGILLGPPGDVGHGTILSIFRSTYIKLTNKIFINACLEQILKILVTVTYKMFALVFVSRNVHAHARSAGIHQIRDKRISEMYTNKSAQYLRLHDVVSIRTVLLFHIKTLAELSFGGYLA